jgi:nitronate monooxygenase
MVLDELKHPIVLAPLAGGASTPELTAAVSEGGGVRRQAARRSRRIQPLGR